jgi:DNA replication protein DnaC
MTNDETIQKLLKLKMPAFVAGFRELIESVPDKQITIEEQIGLLVDREWIDRENRRLERRIRDSRVYAQAAPDQVICDPARGLERALWRELTGGGWLRAKLNITIVGATGTGKSFIASALAYAACQQGFRALFLRVSRLLEQLSVARMSGEYAATLQRFAKFDVLVLDDFLMAPMTDTERRDLVELLEDRYDKSSTILTTQLPTKSWHEAIGDPTIADAICDRVGHNSHILSLRGQSMRRQKGLKTKLTTQPAD